MTGHMLSFGWLNITLSLPVCMLARPGGLKKGSDFDSPLQIAPSVLSQRCAWCEKVHAQLGCVARVWPGAFAAKFFNSLLSGNSGLLTKIVHADIAIGSSYRKCWTVHRGLCGLCGR